MSYTIKQEKFEGPLELLLELIQSQKLSINEISLARVTDSFLGHLKDLRGRGGVDNEILAEFLVIAAQLLLIKSRSLLPQFAVTPEEKASIVELEGRLREYQRIREAAEALGAMAKGGQKSFARPAYAGEEVLFRPPNAFAPEMFASAFERLLRAIPKIEKLVQEKIKKVISLEEKIKQLQSLLTEKVERAFSELVSGAKEKVEVIVSFLAILELAKQKLVSVKQLSLFGDITIHKTP